MELDIEGTQIFGDVKVFGKQDGRNSLFPRLQIFNATNCIDLSGDVDNLRYAADLKELKIEGCPKLSGIETLKANNPKLKITSNVKEAAKAAKINSLPGHEGNLPTVKVQEDPLNTADENPLCTTSLDVEPSGTSL
jgi:hypothetical protein